MLLRSTLQALQALVLAAKWHELVGMEQTACAAAAAVVRQWRPNIAGAVYSALGNAHQWLGECGTAIEYHHKHLAIAREVGDRAGEGGAYGNLGNAHESLGEYGTAIEYHHKHLAIAQEVSDRAGKGGVYNNWAYALQASGQHVEAVEQASQAVQVYARIEREVGDGALRISLFAAEQVKSYRILQEALLATGRAGPALAVAERELYWFAVPAIFIGSRFPPVKMEYRLGNLS
jgi:tetratricopeptide (TPR) repeat protein